MAVTLTIENETSLPDGGPLSYTITGKRGIDIGRDAYLDWALPDPTRTVSGKHCEVRYRDGGYWLHDVSRNGTFLNRNTARMQEPHLLRDGDRIEVGRYIIAVRVDGDEAQSSGMQSAPASPEQYWDAAGESAAPISPRDLRPARELRPVQADFREWAIDVPAPTAAPSGYDPYGAPPPPPPGRNPAYDDMGWAQGPAPIPVAPAPVTPMPTPRRPVAAPPDGGGPWGGPPAPAATPGLPDWGASPPAGPDAWGVPPPMPVPVPAPSADPGWPEQGPAAAPLPDLPPAPQPRPAPAAPAGDNPWGTPTLAPAARAPAPVAMPPATPPVAPPPVAAPVQAPDVGPPSAAPAQRPAGSADEFVRRFAKGAGIPPEVIAWRDPGDLAEEFGALMKLAAESVKQLLSARTEAKRVARTGSHTTIQALDNNPLKFSPTPEDALKIMLGRPTGGYLDARRAFEQSFKDLKTHQLKTYSAMQNALRLLMEDLDPDAIETSQEGGGGGLGALLSSKKAKLWDLYCTRWDTLTSPHEDGMVDAFMMFFAECYDRGSGKS